MSNKFEQISIKPGFMKHNGGILFRTVSEIEYEFKTIINENHLNAAGITHGGYLSALIDAGAGTAAHRTSGNAPCVTISLDLKFIGASKVGDEVTGFARILKKTKTLIFLFCELKCNDKIITSASGIWKILKIKPSDLGPGG
ncbi:PaaI family thioesterase [Candidatus Pelagibacter sp.]|nr:PaaI family thioesterase [Candidatus Pelagibacter sp.]